MTKPSIRKKSAKSLQSDSQNADKFTGAAKQLFLINQKYPLQYGGVLRTKAKNRGARPLSRKDSMHLVMRSSQTKNELSFKNPRHFKKLGTLLIKGSRIFFTV